MNGPSPAFSRNTGDVIAEIVMTRAAFSGAVVLVEGPSDSRFLGRHLPPRRVQMVICGSKGVVIAAIIGLDKTQLVGYVGIVDLDFDHHLGYPVRENIIDTGTHDVETLLLSTRLPTVLAELGNTQKVGIFELRAGHSVSEALVKRAAIFAQFRYLNEVAPALGIAFDRFSPWKYLGVDTWTVDESRLLSDFASVSNLTEGQIRLLIAALPDLRNWRDIQGHDTLAILSIGLRQVLADGRQVSESALLSALRLAFSEQDFRSTELHKRLQAWESSAAGLPLFS